MPDGLDNMKGYRRESPIVVTCMTKKVYCFQCGRVIDKASSQCPDRLVRKCRKLMRAHRLATGHTGFRLS